MNTVDRARANAFGRYATNSLMKDGASMNLRQQSTNRDVNMLAAHARHPVPTKATNNNFNNADIALYTTRSNNSLMNYEENGDMSLYTQIRNGNRDKIVTLGEDLLPNYGAKYDLNNSMDTITRNNTCVYYPHLHKSDANRFPKKAKPTLIDDRMLQHTSDREWNYESDQIINAKNLYQSGRFKDRLARQENADREFLGMPKQMDNWSEARAGYATRPAIPLEDLEYQVEKRLTEQQSYNQLDDENIIQNIQRISLARADQDMVNPKWHLTSGNNDMIVDRVQNNYDRFYKDVNEQAQTNQQKGFLETVTSTILKLFKKEDKNKYGDRKQTETFEDTNLSAGNTNPYNVNREKSQSTYIIRDGEIMTVAPETLDTYGSVYISPVSRTMAMLNNGQLVIIQKYESDAIYGGDLRPYADDLIVTSLPVNFTEKIRERIQNSEGRKFKELSDEDFKELLDFISKNPSVQHRVSSTDIMALLKDDQIDKAMLDAFEGKNIIIDNDALANYFKMNDLKRGHEEKDKRYVDPDTVEYKEQVDNPAYQQAQDRTVLQIKNERKGQEITSPHIEDMVNSKVETFHHHVSNQLLSQPAKVHSFSHFSIK